MSLPVDASQATVVHMQAVHPPAAVTAPVAVPPVRKKMAGWLVGLIILGGMIVVGALVTVNRWRILCHALLLRDQAIQRDSSGNCGHPGEPAFGSSNSKPVRYSTCYNNDYGSRYECDAVSDHRWVFPPMFRY